MPNHIKNRIELIGSLEDVKSFVEKFSTFFPSVQHTSYDGHLTFKNSDDIGWLDPESTVFTRRNKDAVLGIPDGFKPFMEAEWTRFPDFEKVFPVPDVIKAVGNSISIGLVDVVKAKYFANVSTNPLLAGLELMSRAEAKVAPEDQMQFELACKAYEETGFAYWYDWNCEKWGTKWNAYSCEKISDNIFEFDTAWSGVPDIIKEISKSFTGTIEYKFADEDTGSNVGVFKVAHGVILSEHKPKGQTKEAYDVAFDLRPEDKVNYKLVGNTYEYIEEE